MRRGDSWRTGDPCASQAGAATPRRLRLVGGTLLASSSWRGCSSGCCEGHKTTGSTAHACLVRRQLGQCLLRSEGSAATLEHARLVLGHATSVPSAAVLTSTSTPDSRHLMTSRSCSPRYSTHRRPTQLLGHRALFSPTRRATQRTQTPQEHHRGHSMSHGAWYTRFKNPLRSPPTRICPFRWTHHPEPYSA